MTRTERATSPRAIMKDRSEPRNAMGKEMTKKGAGPHNWGSLMDERELEEAALEDEVHELAQDDTKKAPEPTINTARKTSLSLTTEERQKAVEFRKNALKSPGIDLASIARTSAAMSHSPEDTITVVSDADSTHSP